MYLHDIARYLVAALVIAMAGGASGATIYVSPDGDDDHDGSAAKPLATPEHALSVAGADDTIYLRAGRYPIKHFLWINKPGVTLASYPKETAVLAGSSRDEQALPHVVCIVADRVTLLNLEIVGGAHHGVKIDVDATKSTDGVQVRGCRIRDSGTDCVKTFNADHLLIEDCEIGPSGVRDPSNAEGIDSVGSKGAAIRRCYVHDTTTNGLYLKGGARDGLVEACRVERTGKFGGILLGQDTDLEFMRDGVKYEAIACVARNNIVCHTGSAGLGTYSGDDVRFENNTLIDVAGEGQAALWVVTNSRGVPARRVSFKNNIVVTSGERPVAYVKELAGRLDCDHNIYFAANGQYRFEREAATKSQSWSFDDWRKQMGVDAASQTADPLLKVESLYVPLDTSPAIGRGQPLPSVKTDYSGRPLPTTAPPDIGAQQHPAK